MEKGNAPVIFGDGSQTRDFVFVEDVVKALIIGSKNGTGIFNVGTGVSHSFNDVVEILNDKLGLKIEPVYSNNPIGNYVAHTQADISKMNALGFNSRYSLEEGIEKIVVMRFGYD